MSKLSLKFLKGAQKVIRIGGFDAQIERKTSGGINPSDPLGPPLSPVTDLFDVRVFVDEPETFYEAGNGLVRIGDGTLYVDLLSCSLNTETNVVWFPRDGDVLVYSNGKRQSLSNTKSPEANGNIVVTSSTVTGISS